MHVLGVAYHWTPARQAQWQRWADALGAQLTLLHYAAAACALPLMEALLGAGASARAQAAPPSRLTPLHSAVSSARTAPAAPAKSSSAGSGGDGGGGGSGGEVGAFRARAVALLASAGAEVDGVDGEFSQTPLHLAAANGFSEAAEALLAAGARAATRDRFGDTPAALAEDAGHAALAARLAQAEAEQQASCAQ